MSSRCAFVGKASVSQSLWCGRHSLGRRHNHHCYLRHAIRINDSKTVSLDTLASAATASFTDPYSLAHTATTTFDAVLPDTTILIGFGIILVVCAIAANVWANQVVPISRTKLAIAKQKSSNSTLRQYLDDLLEIENSNYIPVSPTTVNGTMTFATSMEDAVDRDVHKTESILDNDMFRPKISGGNGDGSLKENRAFERWLFTDWLEKDSKVRKTGRQKEPAIPILKSAKWNSGDNPVLVATTLILLGVLLTSVTERITSVVLTN